MTEITINQDTCTACGACVALCTGQVFAKTDKRVEVVRPEECWLCGHCVAVCPPDAITHSDYPLDECPKLDTALPSLDGLVATLRERRSARVFRDKPVPREVVRELVDAARWSPSAHNWQRVDWQAYDDPARIAALSAGAIAAFDQTAKLLHNRWLRPFLYLTLGVAKVRAGLEVAEDFTRLVQRHAQGEDPLFRRAPVVLVAHVPTGYYFGRDDAIYATYSLMLAAQRMGLGACQIGWFTVALERSQQLRDSLGLPPERKPEVTLILGYPVYRFRRVLPRRQPVLSWG